MLTVVECKKYLEDDSISDIEAIAIRDAIQKIAEVALETIRNKDAVVSNDVSI